MHRNLGVLIKVLYNKGICFAGVVMGNIGVKLVLGSDVSRECVIMC